MQVEDGRQVGPDPEQRVGVIHLDGGPLGLAQQVDRPGRIAAPGRGDGQRRRGVDLLGTRHRLAGAGDLDRLAREALALGEDAVEHLELSQPGQDRRALRTGFARDQLDGAARRVHRPGRITGCAPDLGQPLVEQPEPDPVASGIEPADRRLEEGRRPGGLPDREGRLRGANLEVDPVERRCRPPARRTGAAGAGDEGQRQLEGRQLVGRRVTTAGEGGGLDRRAPGTERVVGRQPVPGDGGRGPIEAARQGRVMARPGDRQQVEGDGLADRWVTERDRRRRLRR